MLNQVALCLAESAFHLEVCSDDEVNGGANADQSFGPDAAAMAVDDPLHNCQADSRPLEFSVGVQPLKRLEHLVGMAHVEARTIILDEYGPAMGG